MTPDVGSNVIINMESSLVIFGEKRTVGEYDDPTSNVKN
jgi:hypothetical protein